jgi:hypothetical protein
MLDVPVGRFANDPRRDFAGLNGHRLINDPLLLGVVTHFDVAGNRKILAERMPDEAVVGKDAAQVVVPRENDARAGRKASRSNQLTLFQTEVTDGSEGKLSSIAKQRTRSRQL